MGEGCGGVWAGEGRRLVLVAGVFGGSGGGRSGGRVLFDFGELMEGGGDVGGWDGGRMVVIGA